MGFIRKGGVVIFSIVLLLSLIVLNALFTVSSSLEYENIQKNLNPILKEIVYDDLNGSEIEENFGFLQKYCENHLNEDYLVENDFYNLSIPCEKVVLGNQQTFIDTQINDFIEEVYYKDYNCGFIGCFKESSVPFFLLSQKSKDYLQNKFYLFLIFLIVLSVLIFFFLENRDNIWIILGSLLIVSSLPFMKASSFAFGNETMAKIYSVFLASSYKIFLICLILGILFLAIGITLKFWSLEDIREMFRKKESNLKNIIKIKK
jgi:hypothetical protein